jgi:hypothetical protein
MRAWPASSALDRRQGTYVIVVQALGIEKVGQLQLQVQADSTPAWLGFSINISGS